MPSRTLSLFAALAAVAALAGCGGGEKDPSVGRPATVDSNDRRAVALDCLTRVEGLDARLDGDNEIVVGDGADAPRVRVYLTSGEAEAAVFEGKAEGAEQIGAMLLFVKRAGDAELEKIEFCLDNQ